jgi:hypothetical protein
LAKTAGEHAPRSSESNDQWRLRQLGNAESVDWASHCEDMQIRRPKVDTTGAQ